MHRHPDTPILSKACRLLRAAAVVGGLQSACHSASATDAPPAPASPDAPTVVYILDGSGSMWGRLEGDKDPKITVAGAGITKALEKMHGANVGLVSFGHRRKGDCSDVEVIADPAPLGDGTRIVEPVEKLNPKGKGPLTAGLRAAASAIGGNSPAGIVLIHDNADNCREDICAAASELAKSSPGLNVYTVGIALEPDEAARMRCVATATHGQMFEPKDADELGQAIEAASLLALHGNISGPPPIAAPTPPPPPVATASPIDASTPGVHATTVLTTGANPLQLPIAWRVTRDGDASGQAFEDTGPDLWIKLEPGAYHVEAHTPLVSATVPLSVAAGALATLAVPLEAGLLHFAGAGRSATAPPTSSVTIVLTPTTGPPPRLPLIVRKPRAADLAVPTGRYHVAIDAALAHVERDVSVVAGAAIDMTPVAETGRLELRAIVREDSPPLDDVLYTIAVDDPDQPQGRREIARSAFNRPSFALPSGTYYVTARLGEAEGRRLVAVKAGDTQQQTVVLPASRLTLKSTTEGTLAGAVRTTFAVTRLDTGVEREIARSMGETARFVLPPARYRVSVLAGQQNARASGEVELKPGTDSEVVLKVAAGSVLFRSRETSTSEGYWEVTDAGGRVVWRTLGAEPRALLAPGHYLVRATFGDHPAEAAFDIEGAGEKVVAVGAP